jgi:hypothetical protein|tara:strand:- start:4488 stop:4814 length:327 start_codon:yes stop_codon:yes gene_type:complete
MSEKSGPHHFVRENGREQMGEALWIGWSFGILVAYATFVTVRLRQAHERLRLLNILLHEAMAPHKQEPAPKKHKAQDIRLQRVGGGQTRQRKNWGAWDESLKKLPRGK